MNSSRTISKKSVDTPPTPPAPPLNPPRPPVPQMDSPHVSLSDQFGINVFNRTVMKKMLHKEIYQNIINAMDGVEKLRDDYSNTIAVAMKEWAMQNGATHFTHLFHPLTGTSAEKHDAFIEWASSDQMIEKFTGKQLIQGEPDASSFPSGGLRSTFEARGYTGWDPTSPAFIWKEGGATTLFIPSVFFSWTGAVLDSKIPLHRSERKLNKATLRLLELTGIKADRVYTTIGLEQEYFVIDQAMRDSRPDLKLCGRTVFGAPSPKGQELQDHYFGSVKERILCFMNDFEQSAIKLGIPVKTRHNEVAPAQYEVAPIVENATLAIDHNIQLMELMRKVAPRHNLSVLLHEKPFAGLNGSGKHCNWSIATNTGINLLDPTETPENNFHFLILLTAVIHAVYTNAALLRSSIGSSSNDRRLGGHEAPPAIISIYLGDAIENMLDNIEKHGFHKGGEKKGKYELGIHGIPDLTKDYTDRNRTSPFAFTGNKFEFRALGSSANPSMAVTVLNAIVASSLNQILDEIEDKLYGKIKIKDKVEKDKKVTETGKKGKTREEMIEASLSVIRKYLKASRDIRFTGDNYSEEWAKEAEKRKLPILKRSLESYKAMTTEQTYHIFDGILSREEMGSRYEILVEQYALSINIEVNLMIELFKTMILPACVDQQKKFAKSIHTSEGLVTLKEQKSHLKMYSELLERAMKICRELESVQSKGVELSNFKRAHHFCEKVIPVMEELRKVVDQLESVTDYSIWPLLKYRELLFKL